VKKILNITNNPNETIQDVRKQLLFWILTITNILGIPIVIIGFIEALLLDQRLTALLYFFLYSPVLVATIFRSKISIKTCAGMILLSIYLLGVFNLCIYGFSGAAIPIFFTLLVLTTVFFDIKTGFKAILLCILSMAVVGFLFIQNKISLDVALYEINTYPISWFTAAAVLVFLGILIIISFGIIQKKMLHSLQISNQQAEELKKLNLQLNQDILKRKKTENELRHFQDTLEEQVKERTSELDKKNIELKEKNKELEHYNELFEGREFRIKELKDKVKELEDKNFQ